MGIHKLYVNDIMSHFGKIAVKLDGSCSTAEKQRAVDEFQKNEKIKLFVGNIQSAGVGITLTSASNVAFVELPFTTGELMQSIDRLHRIGQKNTVNVYYLLVDDSIEIEILDILIRKEKIMDKVLDGKFIETSTLQELKKMLKL
jgi:SWI/SNF-related matrix-associated actin-dependent regulator 1 of chromatin subfamily A